MHFCLCIRQRVLVKSECIVPQLLMWTVVACWWSWEASCSRSVHGDAASQTEPSNNACIKTYSDRETELQTVQTHTLTEKKTVFYLMLLRDKGSSVNNTCTNRSINWGSYYSKLRVAGQQKYLSSCSVGLLLQLFHFSLSETEFNKPVYPSNSYWRFED